MISYWCSCSQWFFVWYTVLSTCQIEYDLCEHSLKLLGSTFPKKEETSLVDFHGFPIRQNHFINFCETLEIKLVLTYILRNKPGNFKNIFGYLIFIHLICSQKIIEITYLSCPDDLICISFYNVIFRYVGWIPWHHCIISIVFS